MDKGCASRCPSIYLILYDIEGDIEGEPAVLLYTKTLRLLDMRVVLLKSIEELVIFGSK